MRVDREQQAVIVTSVAESFQGANGRERVGSAATVFNGDGQALNPELRAFFPEVFGEFFLAIELNDVAFQFLFRKADNLFPKRRLLFTPCKVQGLLFSSFRSGPSTLELCSIADTEAGDA